MDLEEFQSLVRDTTAANMDEADMLRFFAEALTETAGAGVGQDPDAIHPKVLLSIGSQQLPVPQIKGAYRCISSDSFMPIFGVLSCCSSPD